MQAPGPTLIFCGADLQKGLQDLSTAIDDDVLNDRHRHQAAISGTCIALLLTFDRRSRQACAEPLSADADPADPIAPRTMTACFPL